MNTPRPVYRAARPWPALVVLCCLALSACGSENAEQASLLASSTQALDEALPLEDALRAKFHACSDADAQWDEPREERVCGGDWRYSLRACARPAQCEATAEACEPNAIQTEHVPYDRSKTSEHEIGVVPNDCGYRLAWEPDIPCTPPPPGPAQPIEAECVLICNVTPAAEEQARNLCAKRAKEQFEAEHASQIRAKRITVGTVTARLGWPRYTRINLRTYPCDASVAYEELVAESSCTQCRPGNQCTTSEHFGYPGTTVADGPARAASSSAKTVTATACTTCDDLNADPAAGIASLIERNPAADPALEQERLQMAIDQNVVTDWVKANGMGGIDAARMETAISQLGETYEYQNTPDASLYFTDAYLPEGGFTLN